MMLKTISYTNTINESNDSLFLFGFRANGVSLNGIINPQFGILNFEHFKTK